MITEADKASLIAWMKYVQEIQAVNIQASPDVIWPQKPH